MKIPSIAALVAMTSLSFSSAWDFTYKQSTPLPTTYPRPLPHFSPHGDRTSRSKSQRGKPLASTCDDGTHISGVGEAACTNLGSIYAVRVINMPADCGLRIYCGASCQIFDSAMGEGRRCRKCARTPCNTSFKAPCGANAADGGEGSD